MVTAVALAVVAGPWLGTGPAGADDDTAAGAVITEIGWWSQTPGAAEPDGGFRVTQDASGATTAVAAIRLKVTAKSLATALFVFTEGPTKLSENSADMRLCKGSNDWTAANPGALADAPKEDCSKNVQLKRSATLQSWSADAAQLVSGPGTVTLMVVPGDLHNGSIPFPTYDNLPRVNAPVALPVGIPPPLPIDLGSPDPLGSIIDIIDCPPGLIDVTGSPCLGLPRPLPPTPLPDLPFPASIDLPVPIGFQIEIVGSQMSAAPADEFTDTGTDLSASGGAFDQSTGVLGASLRAPAGPLGDLVGTSPEASAETGAAALSAPPIGTGNAELASSGTHRPWGRIWLLAVVSIAMGVGSVWARRKTAELGL
jgi:hypothetical protein